MSYTPLKNGRPQIVISSLLFSCAAVAVIFYALEIGHEFVLQIIAVLTAAAAISVTARYGLMTFTYTLDKDGFKVIRTHMITRHSKTVCSISYESAVAVIPKAPMKEIRGKYGKIIKRHNYCVNMFPETAYYYIFDFGDNLHIIEFEANSAFYDMVKLFTNN